MPCGPREEPSFAALLAAAEGAVAGWRLRRSEPPLQGCEAIVCVPARQEAGRIEATLAAAIGEAGPRDGFVVAVNGSTDATAAIAARVLTGAGVPFLLAEVGWRPGHGSAPAARRLAMDLAACAAPCGHLLSLDADTVVQPGWRAAYRAGFAAGFDLVCGAIDFDPAEAALLPAADPAAEALVAAYRAAMREAQALLEPDPDNPLPHHGNIGGANFGISGDAYTQAGGLPTPPFGEDRALLHRMRALGRRVLYSEAARVWTSCRLDGRAPGGLADELARNRGQSDPLVDEALEPAAVFALRLQAGTAFRATRSEAGRRAALAPLGLDEDTLSAAVAITRPGEGWQFAEDRSPALRRRRMRLAELRHHWPAMEALVLRLRRERDDRA